ncbi:MAG: hypothetical protein MRZ79_24200 [Bacteroidia bacterium]|nr:hypothetical protein [Bacteroidia bacterium]
MKATGSLNKQGALFTKVIFTLLFQIGLMAQAQVSLKLGGSFVGELSYAGPNSHYYYNNIHARFTNWRAAPKEINLLARLEFSTNFGIDSRFLYMRYLGAEFNKFRVPKLHAYWNSTNRKLKVKLGRIQTPFGSFYDRALPQDRIFISPPIPYNYFINVSSFLGYSELLREPQVLTLDDQRDWGVPFTYELGYTTGLQFHWEPKKDTLSVDVAILQGNPTQIRLNQEVFQPNLMLRVNFQPTYFWKQGFSFNYGGFMLPSENNTILPQLNAYRQLLAGIHTELGYTYFEFRTEVLGSVFWVPVYLNEDDQFELDDNGEVLSRRLSSLSGYADLKAEMPFWPGAYVAYRFGYMRFGPNPDENSDFSNWDDNTFRHSLAIGVPINRNALFQMSIATQPVQNKNWNLNQFRAQIILYL